MLKVEESITLNAPAEKVWETIGEFGGLADWHPAAVACTTSEDGGDVIRTIAIPGGGSLIEKLEALSSKQFSMIYSIVDGPLPVANYRSTLKLERNGDEACKAVWSGEFNASGADDEAAEAVIRGIYTSGLDALKKRFG
jgi:hypothetical protein